MAYVKTAVLDRGFEKSEDFDIRKLPNKIKKYITDIFEVIKGKSIIKEDIKQDIQQDKDIFIEKQFNNIQKEQEKVFLEINNLLDILKDNFNNQKEIILKLFMTADKGMLNIESIRKNHIQRHMSGNITGKHKEIFDEYMKPIKELRQIFRELWMQIKNQIKSNNINKINNMQNLYELKDKIVRYTTKTTGETGDAKIINIEYDIKTKQYIVQLEKISNKNQKHVFATGFKPGKDFFNEVNLHIKESDVKEIPLYKSDIINWEEIFNQVKNITKTGKIIHFQPQSKQEQLSKAI